MHLAYDTRMILKRSRGTMPFAHDYGVSDCKPEFRLCVRIWTYRRKTTQSSCPFRQLAGLLISFARLSSRNCATTGGSCTIVHCIFRMFSRCSSFAQASDVNVVQKI